MRAIALTSLLTHPPTPARMPARLHPPACTRGDHDLAHAETEVLASLPFQVLLFFNLYYSAAYGVALIYLAYIKCTTWAVHDLPRILLFFFIFLWCCGEIMRLYFGYYGNLQEKVPHLAAFVLLTFFPAIPSMIYFASVQPLLRPFDQISSIFMLAGLVSLAGALHVCFPPFLPPSLPLSRTPLLLPFRPSVLPSFLPTPAPCLVLLLD